jgi:hypothetical protein
MSEIQQKKEILFFYACQIIAGLVIVFGQTIDILTININMSVTGNVLVVIGSMMLILTYYHLPKDKNNEDFLWYHDHIKETIIGTMKLAVLMFSFVWIISTAPIILDKYTSAELFDIWVFEFCNNMLDIQDVMYWLATIFVIFYLFFKVNFGLFCIIFKIDPLSLKQLL